MIAHYNKIIYYHLISCFRTTIISSHVIFIKPSIYTWFSFPPSLSSLSNYYGETTKFMVSTGNVNDFTKGCFPIYTPKVNHICNFSQMMSLKGHKRLYLFVFAFNFCYQNQKFQFLVPDGSLFSILILSYIRNVQYIL